MALHCWGMLKREVTTLRLIVAMSILVTNSELAVCSRTPEAGGLAFVAVLGPLAAT